MAISAYDWRGTPIDDGELLRRFNAHVKQRPNPSAAGYVVTGLYWTHGIPEQRALVNGGPAGLVEFHSPEGPTTFKLPVAGNMAKLPVDARSYFYPNDRVGPWHIKPLGVNSETFVGGGMALSVQGEPPESADNRYNVLVPVFTWVESGTPTPQPTPDPEPTPPTGQRFYLTEEEATRLMVAAGELRSIVRDAVNREPGT